MRIGLDIDNVITDFDKKLLSEFKKEDQNKRNRGIINPDGHWIKDYFDWSNTEIEEFLNKNMEEFAKVFEERKDAKKYIDRLIEDGHQIYLISHRIYPHYHNPLEVTKEWLEKHNIRYDKLLLSQTNDKSKECRENNIDIMFDDSRSNYQRLKNGKVNCYLMMTNHNKSGTENLKKVYNWQELYEVVSNMEKKKIILDTDMYNEIDDQFALTYLMKSLANFTLEAITIAPFSNSGYAKTKTIEEGTKKSYDTTLKLLDMLDKSEYKDKVYQGATKYFSDTKKSNAAVDKIIEIALKNEKTTIIAIGAITNIALAITKEPQIIDKIKVVWLGGNSFLTKNNDEFNFKQDIKAVQVVFNSKVELVVIPCRNVASSLTTTIYELEHYLAKPTPLNKYLCQIFRECKKNFLKNEEDLIGNSKTIWDLSAIAYEINADWFKSELISCPNIGDDGTYELTKDRHKVIFVNDIFRNKIYKDFFTKMQ